MTDANDLIGTTSPAPRQAEMLLASWQSWDYFYNGPYPVHAFGPQQWPRDKGPVPTALPYAQILISEGAEFVFRNGGPTFTLADDPDAESFLKEVIQQNSLEAQWISLAENAGNQGAVAVKFSFDRDREECPVRISFLDIPQECRLWMDPHDVTRVLMARVQYPYRDLQTGDWYYYREEWTPDFYVKYQPLRAATGTLSSPRLLPGYSQHLGDDGPWQVEEIVDNPFGLVPFAVIRNREVKGNPLGEGDCWRVFRVMDRLAITMHGEDRSNQFHSEPIPVAKNARFANDGPLAPGEPIEILNEDPQGPAADFELAEPSGQAREYTYRSLEEWKDVLWGAVGLSRVDPKAVSNKGNMTALAFSMLYGRTIATSNRKRVNWGSAGLSVFFRNMLLALARVGGFKQLAGINAAPAVSCEWPNYFEQTDQDKSELTDRTRNQVAAGFLTRERGAERVARAEKLPPDEVMKLLEELRAEREAAQRTAIASESGGGTDAAPVSDDVSELHDVLQASGANNFTA